MPVSRSRYVLSLLRSCPPYLGGKRRLAPLILATIAEILPPARWQRSRFLDPFCGGGAVALAAKGHGFEVTASDIAERGAVVARALIANSELQLRREDVLDLYAASDAKYPRTAARFASEIWTEAQAQWIDRALARARRRTEPTRSLLDLLIVTAVLRLYPMSLPSATDARHAATEQWDRISPRRLGHYLRARTSLAPERLWRIAEEINAGVIGGRGHAERGDARDVLAASEVEVAYLDPPYANTTGYDKAYAPIDALLLDEEEHGPAPTLDELFECAAAIPVVAISYGGPGVTLEDLKRTVRRHRPVRRAVEMPYPRLRAVATERTNRESREFIVVATS